MNLMAHNRLGKDFTEKLLNSQSDIIVILEWNGDNLPLQKFKEKGYHVLIDHPRKAVHGICVLSKIKGEAIVLDAPVATPCALPLGNIRFKWKEEYISLIAVHIPPPVSMCEGTNGPYMDAIASWVNKGRMTENKGVSRMNDPAILAGDFNCFPFNGSLGSIKDKGFNDAFGGLALTETTWKPLRKGPYLARIDYILSSAKFKTLNAYRYIIPGSDHLGITADLELTDAN
jgi:exonuclease III